MPYAYIHYIKLKIEILNDKRFIFDCNESQKWLFIGLLLLAGNTKNCVPNDENYLKNRLNLSENSQKIRENLDVILKLFPKITCKGGYIKFKNFSQLHNLIGNSRGTPKETNWDSNGSYRLDKIRVDKISIDNLRVLINEFITRKNWVVEGNPELLSDIYRRHGKSAKKLFLLAKDVNLAKRALIWVSDWARNKGLDWTIETVLKKYPDFIQSKRPDVDKTPKEIKNLGLNIGNTKIKE